MSCCEAVLRGSPPRTSTKLTSPQVTRLVGDFFYLLFGLMIRCSVAKQFLAVQLPACFDNIGAITLMMKICIARKFIIGRRIIPSGAECWYKIFEKTGPCKSDFLVPQHFTVIR